MKKVYSAALLLLAVIATSTVFAQSNIGVGTTTPDPTAVLDVSATDKGVLIPRLTTAQRTAIASPATGLMVYDTNLGCFYYYNSTSWISLCQAGPAGPVGPTGPQGTQGQVGSTGPQGNSGANGATGPQGNTGVDGVTGPQGPAGAAGTQGATGPQGPQGTAGAAGATGPQGPQGVAGANGSQGAVGPQGPTGAQGVAGANGAAGAQGPQGIQGPAGANGAAGAQGPQGVQGATGPAGTNGTNGITGPTGSNGTNGVNGATGPTGPSWVTYQDNQSAAVTVNPANFPTFTQIPGLSRTITLTSPAKIFVLTDGGIQTNSASTTGYSVVDVAVEINGNLIADGGFKRLNAINNAGIVGAFAFWSMGIFPTYPFTTSGAYTLPAGTYTITVQARGNGGSNAIVGGDNTTVLQGVMQIFIIQ